MNEIIKDVDKSWTLFLDRDGVINVRPYRDYVKKWEEFEFLPGVLEAFKIFAKVFDRILIVTNQQGISKELMTPRDLYVIHQNMTQEIVANGGRVDAIYYCPDRYNKPHHCRKPGIRMAKWAKRDFPEIEYHKSFMVGDTTNDMLFGRKLDMTTILIEDEDSEVESKLYDKKMHGLFDFAQLLTAID